jgi:hypothetical protein
MAIICEKWTPRRTNTLRGFADVLLTQTYLRIRDVAVHEKDGRRWAQLPGRPMIDRDGVAIRDDQGKTKYATILQFETREASDDFSRATIAAVLAQFPEALDGDDHT